MAIQALYQQYEYMLNLDAAEYATEWFAEADFSFTDSRPGTAASSMSRMSVGSGKNMSSTDQADDEKVEEQFVEEQPIRIMVIDKGFGGASQKLKHFCSEFTPDHVHTVSVTEPSDKPHYDQSVAKLTAAVMELKPSIMIASSRGGKYAASLLNSKDNSERHFTRCPRAW